MDYRLSVLVPKHLKTPLEKKFDFHQEVREWFGVSSPQGPPEAFVAAGEITIRRFDSDSVPLVSACWQIAKGMDCAEWVGYELNGRAVRNLVGCNVDADAWSQALADILIVLCQMFRGLSQGAVASFYCDSNGYELRRIGAPDDFGDILRQSVLCSKNVVGVLVNLSSGVGS